MSVATRARTSPDPNAARFRLRAPWARSPWSSAVGVPGHGQLPGELVGSVPGPGEDQHPGLAAGQGGHDRRPLCGRDGEQMVGDLGGRRDGVHVVPRRAGQETPREDVHLAVKGGREQHPLAFGRGGLEQSPHRRQEPQVGHLVGFVQHGDLDVAEVAVALLDEVGQTPRAGHDDIGAAAQRGHLRPLRGAAEDGCDGQAHGAGQRRQDRLDLGGQLTGRHQHQAARAARHRVTPGQSGDQRESETQRLTRAGLGTAENVEAGQGVGQHGRLDGTRHGDAVFGQDSYQGRRDAEGGERDAGSGGQYGRRPGPLRRGPLAAGPFAAGQRAC